MKCLRNNRNSELGYIAPDFVTCLKCGKVFYRPVKEYNFRINKSAVMFLKKIEKELKEERDDN